MTVRELIERLQELDPEARVYEENRGELAALNPHHIEWSPTGDGCPFADEEEATEGPIVVFGAWS